MRKRVTEEQLESLLAGKRTTFTFDQITQVLKYAGEDRPVEVTRIGRDVYEMLSITRMDPAERERRTAEYEASPAHDLIEEDNPAPDGTNGDG